MREKVVNLGALKEKAQSVGQNVSQKAKSKIVGAGKKIKNTAHNGKTKVVDKILTKSISITEKQLDTLKNVKSKTTD